MNAISRGLIVAVVQVGLIGLVGARLHYDRATMPRAWIETAGVDPDLPIRGRYVALDLVVPGAEAYPSIAEVGCGRIEVRASNAVAVLDASRREKFAGFARGVQCFDEVRDERGRRWVTQRPVAYFLPEHAPDPTRDMATGELWMEATVPARGAPRPIRLQRRPGSNAPSVPAGR